MKRKLMIIMTAATLLFGTSAMEVEAANKTISASGVWTSCIVYNYQWKATGYTTSKYRHYTNVYLLNGATGGNVAISGRKWGTGKVSQTAIGGRTLIACNNYYGRVYYGF